MQKVSLYVGKRAVIGVVTGSTGTHSIIFDRDGILCSCTGFIFRKYCKHSRWLLEEVSELPVDVSKILSGSSGRFLRSSVNALNELFSGEAYSSDALFAVYGEPGIGKTLLMVQEASWFASQGLNVLYVDTEGSFREVAKQWIPVFEKRFGKFKGKFLFESRKSLNSLCLFLGYDIMVNVKGDKKKGKGKQEFFVIGKVKNELEEVIKKEKIDVVIIDSISSPIRTAFWTAQENYPARADAMALIMGELTRLQDMYDAIILTTHHASMNPANPYDTTAVMRGGMVVKYYSKRVVYINKRGKKGFENYRKFWLVRAEDQPEWSMATVAKITDAGYVDVPKEEWSNVFTDAEKKKIE